MIFHANPRRRDFALSDEELTNLCTGVQFSELPLFHRGESSETRRTAVSGLLVQRLVPSLNSISRGRKGAIEGTERLRLDISCACWSALHEEGIRTAQIARDGEYVLVSEERVPPVEVIVKAALVGTPARIYHGIFAREDRFGVPFEARHLHPPYVRFDYRNPLTSDTGERLRDECMPLGLADRFIDTEQATASALRVFDVIGRLFAKIDLEVLDACFLFDESGRVLTYEISPDNMRVKRVGWTDAPQRGDEFDKDLWRQGAEDEVLMAQWGELRARLLGSHAKV